MWLQNVRATTRAKASVAFLSQLIHTMKQYKYTNYIIVIVSMQLITLKLINTYKCWYLCQFLHISSSSRLEHSEMSTGFVYQN